MNLFKMPSHKDLKSSDGNILFIILIAVALFASLSYAVTNSSRSGNQSITKEDANLIAARLSQYAASINQSIERLRVTNNCTNEEINFRDYYTYAGHNWTNANINATRRPDGTCDVFMPSGGNIFALKMDKKICQTGRFESGECFGGIVKANILNIGLDKANGADPTGQDTIFWIRYVHPDVCNALRQKNSVPTSATLATGYPISANIYNESAPTVFTSVSIGDSGDPDLRGKYNGCYYYGGTEYGAYFTLIAR